MASEAKACPMCVARGKTWEGDEPRCAFPAGATFQLDNWHCATMNTLRDLARRDGLHHRDDMGPASFGAVPFEGEVWQGYIVMTWYKDRGRTGMAVLMNDDDEPGPLTLEVAMDALQARGVTPTDRSESDGEE